MKSQQRAGGTLEQAHHERVVLAHDRHDGLLAAARVGRAREGLDEGQPRHAKLGARAPIAHQQLDVAVGCRAAALGAERFGVRAVGARLDEVACLVERMGLEIERQIVRDVDLHTTHEDRGLRQRRERLDVVRHPRVTGRANLAEDGEPRPESRTRPETRDPRPEDETRDRRTGPENGTRDVSDRVGAPRSRRVRRSASVPSRRPRRTGLRRPSSAPPRTPLRARRCRLRCARLCRG